MTAGECRHKRRYAGVVPRAANGRKFHLFEREAQPEKTKPKSDTNGRRLASDSRSSQFPIAERCWSDEEAAPKDRPSS